jgi:sarcosine oxidase
MKSIFEIAVIGKGMIGTATAKYLAKANHDVLLIGPNEPSQGTEALVYASHYDAARICRRVGSDHGWTQLNLQSLAAFPEIEQESGINFHCPVSCLYVSEYPDDPCLRYGRALAADISQPPRFIDSREDLNKEYPMFIFPHGVKAMIEPAPSGYIRPLDLISAQLKIFENNGGLFINDTVIKVQHNRKDYQIITQTGHNYLASKVIVCSGSFTNFNQLINHPLAINLESETVLLVETPGPIPEIPCLLWETSRPDYNGIYLIGPVLYPDQKYYIKMGCNLSEDFHFNTLSEIQHWFKSDDHIRNKDRLLDIFKYLMPHIKINNVITKPCIIARTPHKKPYIGQLDHGLFVAAGGNGYSAKCSDAIGQATVHFVRNQTLPPALPAASFHPILA